MLTIEQLMAEIKQRNLNELIELNKFVVRVYKNKRDRISEDVITDFRVGQNVTFKHRKRTITGVIKEIRRVNILVECKNYVTFLVKPVFLTVVR